MNMQQIIDTVRTWEGALAFVPAAGGDLPELAWGDVFFYYAPDGVMPERTQPYGTIITKNYPEDEESKLDAPDRFRVNIHVGREQAARLRATECDPADTDVFFPHPLYGKAGWLSVVNPGENTGEMVLTVLRDAHAGARARMLRRG